MSKKGFTLVELLAVVFLLSIIAIIAIPRLTGVLSSNKQRLYDQQIDQIEKIATQYVTSNPDLITDTLPFDVQLSSLCTDGYIACPILNPIDNSEITGYITVDEDTNGIYTYTFVAE